MSNYTKTTNFTSKDSLASGNPLKIVRGSEFDTEFNNISTAISTKADSASPALTGTATAVNLSLTGNLLSSGTVTIDNSITAGSINTDTISEKTSAAGVTVDGVLIKDNAVTASGGFSGAVNGTVGATTPTTGAFTTISASGDATFSGTGQIKLPVGTTAQRSGSPTEGMLRYNSDLDSFEGYVDGAWGGVGGAQAGGVIYENNQTVTANYTITTNKNGMSAGPITVANGVTVTIPDGSTWSII